MRFLIIFDRIAGIFLGLLVALMMVMTFVDVVLRELFFSPLIFAPELTMIGLAAMVYLGLPIVSARQEHITISLFENLFRGRAQRFKKAVISLLLAVLMTGLAYQLWIHAGKMGAEHLLYLGLKKVWIGYCMSLLAGFTAVVFVVRAWVDAKDLRPKFGGQTDLSSSAGS
jgi:TRAP-type C4-dicarboxylate transport system permease small subunit